MPTVKDFAKSKRRNANDGIIDASSIYIYVRVKIFMCKCVYCLCVWCNDIKKNLQSAAAGI